MIRESVPSVKMAVCKKCKQYLAKTKGDIVKCKGQCGEHYHKTCLPDERCEECRKSARDSRQNTPTMQPKTNNMEEVLGSINEKLEIVRQMRKEMQDITESLDFMEDQLKELIDFKKETIERLRSNEKKIAEQSQKNVYLEKCIKSLEEKVSYFEYKEKERNIELVGVEKQEKEDINQIIVKIAETIKVEKEDIEGGWRVGRETPNGRPRPIVVRLRSRAARDQWLQARKKRILNSHVFKNDNETPIFINENINKGTRELFWQTKNTLKNKFKFFWIQNGKILVKKNENEKKIYQIRCENDYLQLIS